ncbi:MAG: TetR/AcrR family transcriptional regulator [Betaproteobacteria bacterium]|nr:TetR/AcrR family transcriptional regulator [Betaproteobacteria bacterium]
MSSSTRSRVSTAPARGSMPRAPAQERSQQRVELALQATERLLLRLGPEGTSIPEIAHESGVPRASLYQFFPSKYAVFSHLAEVHLTYVAALLAARAQKLKRRDWRTVIRLLINEASDYYDATPVAGMLVLGGPFSRAGYLSQVAAINRIGREVGATLAQLETPLVLPKSPDAATLAVEIAFACMKFGYYRDSRISRPVRQQACNATVAYLAAWEK